MCIKDKELSASFLADIHQVIELFKGKWMLDVLTQVTEGNTHYGKILRAVPGINSRILSQRLRELEQSGILHREVFPTTPPEVEYSLTEKGEALSMITTSMSDWYRKYNEV